MPGLAVVAVRGCASLRTLLQPTSPSPSNWGPRQAALTDLFLAFTMRQASWEKAAAWCIIKLASSALDPCTCVTQTDPWPGQRPLQRYLAPLPYILDTDAWSCFPAYFLPSTPAGSLSSEHEHWVLECSCNSNPRICFFGGIFLML